MGGGTSKPKPDPKEAAMATLIEHVKSNDFKAFEKLLEENMGVLNLQDKVGVMIHLLSWLCVYRLSAVFRMA